jgi:pimeloyl-ACP methyl ester carboxylesterase
MARRALLIPTADVLEWCSHITVPTLVVTGEPGLDYVVPADRSLEYLRAIPGARHVILERTGHLGTITRADRFAEAVRQFTRGLDHAAA